LLLLLLLLEIECSKTGSLILLPLTAQSENFIELTFVVVSHKTVYLGCFAPLTRCTQGQLNTHLPWPPHLMTQNKTRAKQRN